MKKDGSEALEGSGEKKEKKPEGKHESKKKGEKKERISEMRIRPLHDGSYHIEHHHEDKHGMPSMKTHEYSAATKEDLKDHVEEHMPEGDQDEAEGAGEAGGEAAPAEGAQPPASAAGAGGDEEE